MSYWLSILTFLSLFSFSLCFAVDKPLPKQPMELQQHLALMQQIEWMTEDYPPYNFVEQGKVTGVATELLRALYQANQLVFPEQNLLVYPWPRAYYRLQHNKNSCLFSTTYTSERERLFNFFGPITDIKISIIALKESPISIRQLTDLENYSIGLVKQDIGHQVLLKQHIKSDSFVFLKTGLELVKMLQHHRVDIIVYGEAIAKSQFDRAGMDPASYQTLFVLEHSKLGFACNKHVPISFIQHMQQTLNTYKITKSEGNSSEP